MDSFKRRLLFALIEDLKEQMAKAEDKTVYKEAIALLEQVKSLLKGLSIQSEKGTDGDAEND